MLEVLHISIKPELPCKTRKKIDKSNKIRQYSHKCQCGKFFRVIIIIVALEVAM